MSDAVVTFSPPRLLRRHVRGRAEREHRLGGAVGEQAGEAEVDHLRADRRQQHVRRLEVPVHHPGGVDRAQRRGRAHREPFQGGAAQRPVPAHLLQQRRPRHVLGDEVGGGPSTSASSTAAVQNRATRRAVSTSRRNRRRNSGSAARRRWISLTATGAPTAPRPGRRCPCRPRPGGAGCGRGRPGPGPPRGGHRPSIRDRNPRLPARPPKRLHPRYGGAGPVGGRAGPACRGEPGPRRAIGAAAGARGPGGGAAGAAVAVPYRGTVPKTGGWVTIRGHGEYGARRSCRTRETAVRPSSVRRGGASPTAVARRDGRPKVGVP